MQRILSSLLLSSALLGCATTQPSPPTSFFDYQLYSPDGQPISLEHLPQSMADADVILIGEWHTHTGVHRFQTDLVRQLIKQGNPIALSMEQFSRDHQPVLDQYLAGEIGEQTLINDANAWPNYRSDYRPFVEYAKSQQLEIIAANAPKNHVRCIGRQGLAYLSKLETEERKTLAADINTAESPYKQVFMASMHHGEPAQTERQYAAQVTWDETMAESIVMYLEQHPTKQVVHIAGKFHVQNGLGTKASILSRNPNLNVVVINPVGTLDAESSENDFQLWVLPPPARFIKDENRMKAYHALGKRNKDLECR